MSVPVAPVAPYVPPQNVPAQAPVTGGPLITVVTWQGADCIDVTAPDPNGALLTANYCGGRYEFPQNPTGPDSTVGADPIMGDASQAACEILDDRLVSSAVRGDGTDVNCVTRYGAIA